MKAVCISHVEDADGLICAAYLRILRNASILLVNYDEFQDTLTKVRPPLDEVYICDLNIREDLTEEILRINIFADVTLVDHHPTAEGMLERLKESGVVVIHSPIDCASALLYDRFREELGKEASRLAAYAAISDQFENGPIATKILEKLDRHFVQHEALILTHALHRKTDTQFRLTVVEELSRFIPPHMIKDVQEAALAHLDHVARLLNSLPTKASRLGNIAYVDVIDGTSSGAVAGLLVDAMDVDVGVCYKLGETGAMNLSIRGRRGLKIHLGEITKRLADKYGGFGGGHSRASGASIPHESYIEFIKDLERELEADEQHSTIVYQSV